MDRSKKSIKKIKGLLLTAAVILFWLAVWEVAALAVDSELLLPAPHLVLLRLARLFVTIEFRESVFSSVGRIMAGYFSAVAISFATALIICRSRLLDALLSPILKAVTATPVASFIILALVWIGRETVPAFISALIVIPVMTSHICSGIKSVDPGLKRVCGFYGFSPVKKLVLLYIPSSAAEITAGLATSLGLAWKSGVAAEVLCTPKDSIGRYVYEAKLYLETPDLIAWTLTVIILSVAIEKLLSVGIKHCSSRSERKSGISRYIRSDDKDSAAIPAPQPLSRTVNADFLSKFYDGKKLFDKLSLTLNPHTRTALIGVSGCGKTTLLNILSGEIRPDGGSVSGITACECSRVFQEQYLFPWLSAVENVAVFSPNYSLRCNKKAILEARGLLLSAGIDEDSQSKLPAKLSGGMNQRVAIARALISARPLLILDEPFRGLDTELKKQIADLILECSDTILTVTHSPEEAALLDSVLIEFDSIAG